jgi:beta-lactamase class A
MTKLFYFTVLIILLIGCQTFAQTSNSLRKKIQQIVSSRNAEVGISIIGSNGKDIINIKGDEHFPMQSVFKLHIALAVLSEIDKGKFTLDQKIKIEQKDLLPNLYSPIREKYPNGAELTLAEILEYTVSQSDNVGCEVLLRMIGGPQVVEKYFKKNKFKDISIKFNEEEQQNNWDLQFQNWTTPKAANQVLSAFYYNKKKLLTKNNYDFIWKAMRETETGQKRLKGELPAGTVVAHKTGSSGTNKTTGITAAVNDIGIVFLPDGRFFFISVFVTDSQENAEANEKIVADIAKAAWDYFVSKTK